MGSDISRSTNDRVRGDRERDALLLDASMTGEGGIAQQHVQLTLRLGRLQGVT